MKKSFYAIIPGFMFCMQLLSQNSIFTDVQEDRATVPGAIFIGRDEDSYCTLDYHSYLQEQAANSWYMKSTKNLPSFNVKKYSLKNFEVLFDLINYSDSLRDPVSKDGNFEVLYLNKKICVFSQRYDLGKRSNGVYLRQVDEENRLLTQELKMLDAINNVDLENSGRFIIKQSEDEDKVLILHQKPDPWENKRKLRLSFKVFDKNVENLWTKEIELPYLGNGLVSQVILYKENAYFLIKNLRPEADSASAEALTKLFCYNSKTDKLSGVAINTGHKNNFDFKIKILNDGNILCVANCSEENTKRRPAAIYISLHSPGLEKTLRAESYNINEDVLKSHNKGENYYLRDLFVMNDGTIITINEQQKHKFYKKSQTYGYTSSGNSISGRVLVEDNSFGDILITGIRPTGPMWVKKINKEQQAVSEILEPQTEHKRNYFSYMAVSNGKKVRLFLNVSKRELPMVSPKIAQLTYKKSFDYDKTVSIMIDFDASGDLAFDEVFERAKLPKTLIRLNNCYRVADNELILFLQVGNQIGDRERHCRFVFE